MEPRECRICFADDNPGGLIAPCLCSGTSRWIHRGCLDQWRRTAARSSCSVCGFHYKLESMSTRRRYWLLVARDVFLMLCVVLAVTTGCGFVVFRLDAKGELKMLIPRWMPAPAGYYLAGLAVTLMLCGLCMMLFGSHHVMLGIDIPGPVAFALLGFVVAIVNAVLFWRYVKQRHWHVIEQEFKMRVVDLAACSL
jgi:hypothetical protein